MFLPWLTPEPLNREILRQSVIDVASGAVLLFEGTVRNHSEDFTGIVALEYEAQVSMATKIIESIAKEIKTKYPIQKVVVQHRIGIVPLGEPTIIIAISSAHRDEAYCASRMIIDRIKHEAPIWKREILPDGKSQWSRGCTAHVDSKANP